MKTLSLFVFVSLFLQSPTIQSMIDCSAVQGLQKSFSDCISRITTGYSGSRSFYDAEQSYPSWKEELEITRNKETINAQLNLTYELQATIPGEDLVKRDDLKCFIELKQLSPSIKELRQHLSYLQKINSMAHEKKLELEKLELRMVRGCVV